MAINFYEDASWGDNLKLKLGADPNLQIYHNATDDINQIVTEQDLRIGHLSNGGLRVSGAGHVEQIGQSTHTDGYYLKWDNTNTRAVWAAVSSTINISTYNDIGAALVDADLFLVDDGANGTTRKATMSRLSTYINGKVPDASDQDKGLIKVSATGASVVPESVSSTANRSYQIQTNESGVATVNVPWTDTNTTYSVGDGGLTQNDFTNTLKSKLDGITAAATPTNAANVRSALNSAMASNTLTIGDGSTVTTFPGTITSTGKITSDAGIDIDNFNIDGTTITLSSGDMTLDPAGDMIISMEDGSNIDFKNGGNVAGRFYAEDGTASTFFMYENGGESSNDYLSINVATHGATTLTTVDAAAAAAHFEIAADGNITLDAAGNVAIEATTTSVDGILDLTGTTDASDATGDTGILRCEGGASIAKKLYAGSTITSSADVIAYSDERLKENVKTLNGKKVLEMRGVSFDRVDTGKASSGVIAQEMEKVAPELVIDDGNYKGVAYGNVVGYLIEAIKDQQKQIDELKEKCNGCSK